MSVEEHVSATVIQCTDTFPGLYVIKCRHLASAPLADAFSSLYIFLYFVSSAQNVLAPLTSKKKKKKNCAYVFHFPM